MNDMAKCACGHVKRVHNFGKCSGRYMTGPMGRTTPCTCKAYMMPSESELIIMRMMDGE